MLSSCGANVVFTIITFQYFAVFMTYSQHMDEVIQLTAEPDFRSIKLNWLYPRQTGHDSSSFQIHYCELQAWGPNRCRTKMIEGSSGVQVLSGKKYQVYSVIISSLRMATNYSFEVRPMQSKTNTKAYGKTIILPTRGFSAKASLCLPDMSEVEVATGPYFGGRIAVESSDGEKTEHCAIGGDATSSQDIYKLRIEHKACGSVVNRTTVSTFILVQETLPILTHSTRRFLVLCTFQPETLTVRAGINLPRAGSAAVSQPASMDGEMTLLNDVNSNDIQGIQAASLLQETRPVVSGYRRGKKMHEEPEKEQSFLLLSVLMISSVVGVGLTIWWFVPLRKIATFKSIQHPRIFSSESSAMSILDNYANTIRDTDMVNYDTGVYNFDVINSTQGRVILNNDNHSEA